jgi:hypothetical protein
VTHVTWAVSDVDKDNQIPANSNHGSKIIVVPFDGAAFDADTGIGGSAGTGSGGASGASAGGATTGGSGNAASGGVGGSSNPPNTAGTAGLAASGGASAQGGSASVGAGSSNVGIGGEAMAGGTHGGAAPAASVNAETNGCGCHLALRQPRTITLAFWALLGLIAARWRQRRAHRSRTQKQ